jgi:hypothetical protein
MAKTADLYPTTPLPLSLLPELGCSLKLDGFTGKQSIIIARKRQKAMS